MPARAPDPASLLERLVGFDTVSANSNRALIDFIADYLDGLGVAVSLSGEDTGTKANLFATLGPQSGGGVVLSGHTDVVPVEGQAWQSDPFLLSARDGRLYGRGTADMKGFIACALAMAPAYLAAGLARPIHFAFSYDEEVGCLGVPHLIGELGREVKPELVIVGEPTGMEVVDTHKSITVLRTIVTGRDGHSSKPDGGVNALAFAAEIVAFLTRIAGEMATDTHDTSDRFDPAHTTLNVGTISGGTAVNIIAAECRFDWEIRGLPGARNDELLDRLAAFVDADILPRMQKIDQNCGVVTDIRCSVPALESDPKSTATRLALDLTGGNSVGAAAFICEAGLFHQAGLAAVICGPGHIEQAHQPDEYIAIDQLDSCSRFLSRLGDWAANG